VTTEVEHKKMHMANRCILAQDQALYWADSEITYLRWKWDMCLQLAQELELEKLDLADRLEQSRQRNSELVQLGLAAIVFFIGNKNLSEVKDKEEKQDISEIWDQIQKTSN
jgi:hypothetical protein